MYFASIGSECHAIFKGMASVPASKKSAFGQAVWLLAYDWISMLGLGRLAAVLSENEKKEERIL